MLDRRTLFGAAAGVGTAVSSFITGNKAHELLLPKFKKLYPTALQKADPRLASSVCMTEIKKHGVKVL